MPLSSRFSSSTPVPGKRLPAGERCAAAPAPALQAGPSPSTAQLLPRAPSVRFPKPRVGRACLGTGDLSILAPPGPALAPAPTWPPVLRRCSRPQTRRRLQLLHRTPRPQFSPGVGEGERGGPGGSANQRLSGREKGWWREEAAARDRKRGLLQQKGAAILWPAGLAGEGRVLDPGDRAGVAQGTLAASQSPAKTAPLLSFNPFL